MGEMATQSLGQDDNSSGPKGSQRVEAGETVLGSFYLETELNTTASGPGCV